MGEEKRISATDLEWRKSSEYRDKFAEVMAVIGGDRSIIIDFGVLSEEGKKAIEGRLDSLNLHIEHHTRIRVSPQHFVAIVDALKKHLEKMKAREERKE